MSKLSAPEGAPSLTRLATVARALNTATDDVTRALVDVETRLIATDIALEAGVPLTVRGGTVTAPPMLHFAKHRETQRWALVVGVEKSWWTIADAPRPLRIAAAHALPALIRQLERAADEMTRDLRAQQPKIDEAVTLIEAIVWPEPAPELTRPADPRTPRPARSGIDEMRDQILDDIWERP